MMPEAHVMQVGDWTLRVRVPEGAGPFPVMLMLHGWTGDENAMGVFSGRLPANYLLVAPRGLYPAARGGYSWHPVIAGPWPRLDDFHGAAQRLLELLSPAIFPDGDFSSLHLLGFSQGAALSYAFALFHAARLASVAGLAGFVPDGAAARIGSTRLNGMPIFIAHGTRDELVPVARARQAVDFLQQAGAQVTYCEDDVGHKLSANCFRALQAFYSDPNRGGCK